MADDDSTNDGRIDRRKFLGGLGAGVTAGLAGCGGGATPTPTEGDGSDGGDGGDGGDGDDTPTETDTPTSAEVQEGGTPTLGLAVSPDTLNPLQASTVYSFFVIDPVMLYGTATHPDDQSFNAWAFTDWEVMPGNVESSSPTITATLRDDLTFSDGEDLTGEDYKFSVNYYQEQEPTGSLTAAAHKAVEEVRLEDGGTTVNVFMNQKDQRWFTNILGFPILPQHIWSDVDDFSKYSPRQAEEGLVGAGAFRLTDWNWGNWFEFEARDDFPIPGADYADFVRSGAPFVDGLRFEIFGSQTAMEQAVLNGDIDSGFVAGGFTVNNAVKAQQSQELTVNQAQDAGYNHISYNMRRVPFDDVAFRQWLNKMVDTQWIVDVPYNGIGAVAGDYVVPTALSSWRPPAPSELDTYEVGGEEVEVPDLQFPNPGTFNLSGEGLQTARQWLVDHEDAKHDYSWGEAVTDITNSPDGKELYVNGEPLSEAHTDNDGNAGQGPLVFSFQPPQEDVYQARSGQRFVSLMKKVGVPMEPKVKTINSQIPTIYGQEDFDLFSMGWGLGVNVTYLASLYSSEGADLEGDTEGLVFNPMGYTGADELIFRDLELMDFSERRPLVKEILVKIWNDAPTRITEVSNVLEPVNDDWSGWVEQLGGSMNVYSFMNLRQEN